MEQLFVLRVYCYNQYSCVLHFCLPSTYKNKNPVSDAKNTPNFKQLWKPRVGAVFGSGVVVVGAVFGSGVVVVVVVVVVAVVHPSVLQHVNDPVQVSA